MDTALIDRVIFRIRRHITPLMMSALRRCYWCALGMKIGPQVRLSRMTVTWPRRIQLRRACSLEHDVYFNVAGGYAPDVAVELGEGTFVGSGCEFNAIERISVGRNCLIASGTRFIDHNHGNETGMPMKLQKENSAPIIVGDDVWIGANCILLKGVTIGDGAIVAAGSVVNKSVEPYVVVAGVPARVIRSRANSTDSHIKSAS